MKAIGTVRHLFRYPVKSMAGVPIDETNLGWHGVPGDRRLAFRRTAARNGFPFLTASRLAELVLYRPFGGSEGDPPLSTHVRTPDGREVELASDELRAALAARHGEEVELMRLDHGIFDDAPLSVLCAATVRGIEREAGRPLDIRRFRPNVVLETPGGEPFQEDAWVGATLLFGDAPDDAAVAAVAAVAITQRDLRCAMINIDPDTGELDPRVMKAAVRLNGNYAGVYGTVLRQGRLAVGQRVWLKE